MRIQVTINEWTPEETRNELLQVLAEEGGAAVTDRLREQKTIGFIRVGTRLAYDLRYSREFKTETGRTIIAATDRPIPAFEATRATRTDDYSISYIQMDLDDEDRGDGIVAVGVKIMVDPETRRIKLETYEAAPVRLMNVRKDN